MSRTPLNVVCDVICRWMPFKLITDILRRELQLRKQRIRMTFTAELTKTGASSEVRSAMHAQKSHLHNKHTHIPTRPGMGIFAPATHFAPSLRWRQMVNAMCMVTTCGTKLVVKSAWVGSRASTLAKMEVWPLLQFFSLSLRELPL